jgi:hypothetical protein
MTDQSWTVERYEQRLDLKKRDRNRQRHQQQAGRRINDGNKWVPASVHNGARDPKALID